MPIPTASQIADRLALAGVSGLPDAYLAAQVQAAVGILELETGYRPFLATAEPIAVAFDPSPWGATRRRSPSFRLPSGLLGSYTVTVDGAAVDPSLCFALPSHSSAPTQLRVDRGGTGKPGSVVVTGTFGYAADFPDDVFEALVTMAAGLALTSRRETALADGLASWEEAGVKETRGYELTLATGKGWRDEAMQTFQRYRRLDV